MMTILDVLASKRIFAWRVIGFGVAVAYLVGDSYWGDSLFSEILFFVGVILAGTATVGRLWCALYISGYKGSQLITEGPYAMCRHPLYFFNLLGIIGVGLASETLLIPAVLTVAFAVLYPAVLKQEERLLKSRFPIEYSAWAVATPAFWPSPRLMRQPDRWTVCPAAFMRNMMDSVWFVIFVGLMELVEALKSQEVLPTLFYIV